MWSPTVPGPNPERIVDSVLKGEELREQLTEFKAELRRLESQLEARGREARQREEELSSLRKLLAETETQLREAREWRANTQKEVRSRSTIQPYAVLTECVARERVPAESRAESARGGVAARAGGAG